MARIYKNEEGVFCIFSRNTDSEKVAITFEGDFQTAIEKRRFDNNLEGWSNEQIVADLIEGGYYVEPSLPELTEANTPKFSVLKTGKNGVWWKHQPTNTAKYFSFRVFEYNSPEWSDDQWKGRTSGSSKNSFRTWTYEQVADDFANASNTWAEYRMVWNQAFRENEVVFP